MKNVFIIYGILIVAVIALALFKFRDLLPFASKQTVTVNDHKFQVYVAKSDKDKAIGLTKFNSIKLDEGMLFVFDQKDKYPFWMHNMKFPIDIIYIADDKVVDVIPDAQPTSDSSTNVQIYEPSDPANYVLEINDGLAKKYNITKGDTVSIPKNL